MPISGRSWPARNHWILASRLISVWLERKPVKDDGARALLEYMASLKTKIDPTVYKELVAIGTAHKNGTTSVEKAVDVMLAVDLVILAERDEYDTAYILSATAITRTQSRLPAAKENGSSRSRRRAARSSRHL